MDPAEFTEYLVIKRIFYLKTNPDDPAGQTYLIQKRFLYIRSFQLYRFFRHVAYMNKLFHQISDLENYLDFQLMLRRQHFYPFGNIKLNLADRKFVKNTFQYPGDILFPKLFTVQLPLLRHISPGVPWTCEAFLRGKAFEN